jgi:hypothetical protein
LRWAIDSRTASQAQASAVLDRLQRGTYACDVCTGQAPPSWDIDTPLDSSGGAEMLVQGVALDD